MKYFEPKTLDGALDIIADNPGARFLAGGATIVALLNGRLIKPESLISLHYVDELYGVQRVPDGWRIGSMTRHVDLEREERFASGPVEIVRLAAREIANPVIRNMGTIGGSVCNGDATADLPAALVAAGASMEIVGAMGSRSVPAEEFFIGHCETALAEDEILRSILVPSEPIGARGNYLKFCRVHNDYAIVSVAAVMELSTEKSPAYARIALGSVGPTPVHMSEADSALTSSSTLKQGLAECSRLLVAASAPLDDARTSAAYRRDVIPGLLTRCVQQLQERII
jgi:carbon-monoxide dehydrogenase medium subunit